MQARTYHFSPAVNSSFGSLLFGSKPATTDLTASNLRHANTALPCAIAVVNHALGLNFTAVKPALAPWQPFLRPFVRTFASSLLFIIVTRSTTKWIGVALSF